MPKDLATGISTAARGAAGFLYTGWCVDRWEGRALDGGKLSEAMASEGNRAGGYLDFEQKVAELEQQVDELKKLGMKKGIDYSVEIPRTDKARLAHTKGV